MKTLLRFSALAFLIIIFASSVGWGTTYYSQGTGDPEILNKWNTIRGSGGTNPTNFTTAGDVFVIQSGHTMTTTSTWSFGGTGSILQIESGGILESPFAITIASDATFQIDAGGKYIHDNITSYSSSIFKGNESFANTSTVELLKTNPTGPSNVIFGNLIVNYSTNTHVNCAGGLTKIYGNLEIKQTGDGKEFRMTQNTSTSLSIGGDLIITGGTFDFSFGTTEFVSYILYLNGDYLQTGGSFTHLNTTCNLNFIFSTGNKSFSISGGTFNKSKIDWEVAVGNGNTLTLDSNFTLPESRNLTITSGTLSVNSDKTISVRGVLDCKNNIINGEGNFTLEDFGTIKTGNVYGLSSDGSSGSVQVNGTIIFSGTYGANYEYNGVNGSQYTGTAFTNCSGLTINNEDGVYLSNIITVDGMLTITSGNLFLNEKMIFWGAESTLRYNGTKEQTTTDDEFPESDGPYSLTISNSVGVKLHASRIINGSISIQNSAKFDMQIYEISGDGTFNINGGGTLVTAHPDGILGSIKVVGTKNYAVSANYHFNASTAQVIGADLVRCNDLIIENSSSGVTMENDISVDGILDLRQGALNMNSKELTLNGTISYNGSATGTISADNMATINIIGTGSLGILKFTSGNQNIGEINMNRTTNGSATLGSSLTLDGGTFNLTNGVFDISGQTLTFISGNVPIARTNGTITVNTSTNLIFGTAGNTGGAVFTIPSGTFSPTPSLSNLTINRTNALNLGDDFIINGILTLTSGEFGLNTKSLTLNGTVSRTSGSITGDNDANITIGGTGALGTLVFTTGSEYLGTMTINRTSSGTVTLGNDLTINGVNDAVNKGKLTLTEGTLDVGSGRTITFINGNTPIVRTNGTVDNDVSLVFGTTDNLGGAEFTLPSGTFGESKSLKNLTVNRTNNVIFTDDITINGELTLTAGILDNNTNNKLITLSSSGSLDGTEGNAGLIKGRFKRYIPASTGTYAFPLTKSTVNQTAIVNFTTAPSVGSLTAEFISGAAGNLTVQVIDDNGYNLTAYSTTGYWRIIAGDDLAGGVYDLSLYAYSFAYVSDYTKLRIIKRSNSGTSWGVNGFPATNNGDNTTAIVNRTTLNEGFSEFAIASNYLDNPFQGPLPVKLQTFTYNVKQNNALLKWSTSQEINNSGFEIERANVVDNKFAKIGFVKGNGNTNQEVTYNYTDSKLNAGKYKYRLKQIDYNGNFEYFDLEGNVEVGIPTKYDIGQNYPNPFNPMTKIDFELPENGHVNIMIYDMLGREVKSLMNELKQAGYYTIEVNASNLSSGTYFYRMNAGKFVKTLKMVVIK